MKKKNMDYLDAYAKNKLSALGDIDRDGVRNIVDCKPYDPHRDGILGRIAYAATGGRYGQSRDEYEAEKRNRPLIREQRRTERRAERAEMKREQRQAYREAFRKARVERAKRMGKQAGSTSMSERFGNAAKSIEFKPYSTRGNYNPWGSMFDTGMSGLPRKKGKSKKGKSWSGFDMTDNWGFMK